MRRIRSGDLHPEMNLALDEALLREGRETLRLYGWSPPGLSIGFFQRAADFTVPEGFVLVRRPTGGGAIAHRGELTIAWIGRRRRVDEVYASINSVVREAASRLGLRSVRVGEGDPEAAPPGMCFDAHTRYDLLAGRGKFFGSAQRRAGDRFLLHGTLVLERNPFARGARSLGEAIGRPISRAEAEEAVAGAAADLWGVAFEEAEPSAAELEKARLLRLQRYGNPLWNRRR